MSDVVSAGDILQYGYTTIDDPDVYQPALLVQPSSAAYTGSMVQINTVETASSTFECVCCNRFLPSACCVLTLFVASGSLFDASVDGTQLFAVRGDGRMFINQGGFSVIGNSLMNGNFEVRCSFSLEQNTSRRCCVCGVTRENHSFAWIYVPIRCSS